MIYVLFTDLVITFSIPMVIIHVTIALISLRYLTVPRLIGLPIAIYENAYYILLLTYALLNHYNAVLLGDYRAVPGNTCGWGLIYTRGVR